MTRWEDVSKQSFLADTADLIEPKVLTSD